MKSGAGKCPLCGKPTIKGYGLAFGPGIGSYEFCSEVLAAYELYRGDYACEDDRRPRCTWSKKTQDKDES